MDLSHPRIVSSFKLRTCEPGEICYELNKHGSTASDFNNRDFKHVRRALRKLVYSTMHSFRRLEESLRCYSLHYGGWQAGVIAVQSTDSIARCSRDSLQNERSVASASNLNVAHSGLRQSVKVHQRTEPIAEIYV